MTPSKVLYIVIALFVASVAQAQDKLPKPFVTGLKNPTSVAIGNDGRIYVTEAGELDKTGEGRVMVIDKVGKAAEFAIGLDHPQGIVASLNFFYVAEKKRVWKIDSKGKATVFADEKAFPTPPIRLIDITVDEQGVLYVSDSGNFKSTGGAIYRITPKGKVTLVTDGTRQKQIQVPVRLVMDGKSFLMSHDALGELLRIRVSDGKSEKIAEGFGLGNGLAWDHFGRLFITSMSQGKVWGIPRPGERAIVIAEGFKSATNGCLDPTGKFLLVPDFKAGTLTKLPTTIPGWEVDDTPMALQAVPAFPDLDWAGWKGITDNGKLFPLRPLLLTHANDKSNRNFVAIQQGTIHVFPNDPKADKTKIFLDIEKQVFYHDGENEQGLLGLAFHPRYKKTGEFFVFYTKKKEKNINVLSRFKVSKDDPDKADPASEEILLTIKRPFWNHDGGTIVFGPDGYLYIALGDGGAAEDPQKNGQNLKTLLAKVLRIDIDRRDEGKKYAIPKDNPFVDKADALPEIWAYGLRNVWRMSFDRKTGKLWASDVGQNLYEEIDIIEKGGNYGWSIREGLHPFSLAGVGPRKDLIEPIWEYHHAVGKSLTGGHVYRGKLLPELDGHYIYGDYVSTKIWALNYDETKKRVTANRPIRDTNVPILSFGEDEQGEVYLLTTTVQGGRGILKFERSEKK